MSKVNTPIKGLEARSEVVGGSKQLTNQVGSDQSYILSDEQKQLSNHAAAIRALSEGGNNRPSQTATYVAMANSIEHGEQHGIAKLPTGTGKTRIFCNMIHALGINGLILVPRVDLYQSTKIELLNAGFIPDNIILPHETRGTNIGQKLITSLEHANVDWSSGKVAVVMTYQALVSIFNNDSDTCRQLLSRFGVVINDEAHRGLGDKTQNASRQLIENIQPVTVNLGEDDETDGDISLEEKTNAVIRGAHIKFQWFFTATPGLYGKSVEDISQYVIYKRIEEVIREGAIVLPQHITVGDAYPNSSETIAKWKVKDIENISDGCGFIDEAGSSIQEKIIGQYIQLKEKHKKLPGVAFASTIEHAKKIVDAFMVSGIVATRVTSAKGDKSSYEAIEMMNNGELDVIVTVSKVAEGFDYPPLSCAMWFAPSLSPAKLMQGNGRVMRTTEEKSPKSTVDTLGRLTVSPNTYIIEPRSWRGGRPRIETNGKTNAKGGTTKQGSKVSTGGMVGNSFEVFTKSGEINTANLATHSGVDVENFGLTHGVTYSRDDINYVAIDPSKAYSGLNSSFIIQKLVAGKNLSVIGGRDENGGNIYLVNLAGIKEFVGKSITGYAHGEEVSIDGTSYVVIEKGENYKGINSSDLLEGLEAYHLRTNLVIDGRIAAMVRTGLNANGKKQYLVPLHLLKKHGLDLCDQFITDNTGKRLPLATIAISLKEITFNGKYFRPSFIEGIQHMEESNQFIIGGKVYLDFSKDREIEGIATKIWRLCFPKFGYLICQDDFIEDKEYWKSTLGQLEPNGRIKLGDVPYIYIHPAVKYDDKSILGQELIDNVNCNPLPFKDGFLLESRAIGGWLSSVTANWK